MGPERAGKLLVSEGNCSGMKAKEQIQQRLRRRDQQEWGPNQWGARYRGGYDSMVLRFQASDLGARWHSLLTKRESRVRGSFGGRSEGAVGRATLSADAGALHMSSSDTTLLRGLINTPASMNGANTVRSALAPITSTAAPKALLH